MSRKSPNDSLRKPQDTPMPEDAQDKDAQKEENPSLWLHQYRGI